MTSILARAAGFSVQLVTLPLVAAALGSGRYTVYLVITSLLSWIGLLGFGLLPSLSRALAASGGYPPTERSLFAAAAGLLGAISLGLGLLLAIVTMLFDLRGLAGAQTLSLAEFRPAMLAAGVLTALLFFTALAGAMRAGMQQMHITNGWALIATASIISGAWYVAGRPEPSLAGFVIALQAPPALVGLADLGLMLASRRHLRARPTLRSAAMPGLLRTSAAVWLVQLTAFMNIHASLMLVTWIIGISAAAGYGTLLRLELLLSGVIGLIIAPLTPAIASAEHSSDIGWLDTICRRVQLMTFVAATAIGAVIALGGPWLIEHWVGAGITVSPALCTFLGAYFIVWMMQFAQFNLLLGLGETDGLARLFVVETALIFAVAALTIPRWGATGMAAALFLGTLSTTSWALPRRVSGALRWRQARAVAGP